MTLPRHALQPLALAAVLAAAVHPSVASASKADAFEGKIQPVSGKLYQKAGRIELTLGGGWSLNDAFFVKAAGNAKVGWHFSESLSLAVHAVGLLPMPTDSTTVCPTGESCRTATEQQLRQVPGRLRGIAGVEVAWAPIYGKLNTFSEMVVHLDLAVIVGADVMLHDEVLSTDDALADAVPETLRTPGFHVGVGARAFLSEALAVRLELKDYVYAVTVPNGEEGTQGGDTQNQLVAELGISIFFPFDNRRQP